VIVEDIEFTSGTVYCGTQGNTDRVCCIQLNVLDKKCRKRWENNLQEGTARRPASVVTRSPVSSFESHRPPPPELQNVTPSLPQTPRCLSVLQIEIEPPFSDVVLGCGVRSIRWHAVPALESSFLSSYQSRPPYPTPFSRRLRAAVPCLPSLPSIKAKSREGHRPP
jgi:hypothetical protein